MRIDTPPVARDLALAVQSAGGRALVVGGWVRDELAGRTPKDLDLEVFGLDATRLRTLLESFGRVDTVGESFTVYKIQGIDVSLPRRESKTGRGHKGFAVEGDPSLSPEEAARRRDFTINAIARDPLTGEIVDPFGGRKDLADRRLRAVDLQTFGDDSLRVLRALQFAARFELTIDDDTAGLCRSIPLDDLPSERIWSEFEKLLLQADRPSIGLSLGWTLGVIQRVLPELVPLASCQQDPEWHPEGDVWTHTLMVVDLAHDQIADLARGPAVAVMLAALCHDLGKPATTVFLDGRWRSPGHEEAGVEPASSLLDRLNVHSLDSFDVRGAVLGMVAHHLKPTAFVKAPKPVSDGAYRRLAGKVDLELLVRLVRADCRGRGGNHDCSLIERFLERARALGVEHEAPRPIVLGRHLLDLGVSPGPKMGELLRALYERQLEGDLTSLEQGIELARALAGHADVAGGRP